MEKITEINGIEIYYIRSSKFKTGSINITFCDNLSRERAYMNALIPSVLSRGCRMCPTQREVSRKLQNLYGAGMATNVDKKGEIQLIQFVADFVEEVYAPNYKDLLKELLLLLFNIIYEPVLEGQGFRKDFFEQERTNHNNFIKSLINDKRSYAMARCQELMCKDEPYGVNELGSVEDGVNLTAEELYRYYREYFLKKLPVKIFFCGRKEPDELVEIVESLKDKFTGDKIALKHGFKPWNDKHTEITEKMDVTQGQLIMGFRTNIDPQSDEFFALCVANGIFGAGPHSKLFQNVREKNSLAYYAASKLDRYKGLLIAYSGIEIQNKEKAQELILAQMKEVCESNITKEEYESTIRMFKNAFNSYKDTQFSIMDFYIGQIFSKKVLSIDEFVEKISNVTIDMAIEAFKKVRTDTIYFLTSDGMEVEV